MRYYFTARTASASKEALERYEKLNTFLAANGHENINYVHMSEDNPAKEKSLAEVQRGNISTFDYQFKLLSTADALICDITEPSVTVGFQVMHAINNKIPCLALEFSPTNNIEATLPIIFTESHDGLLKFNHIDNWEDLGEILNDFEKEFINKPFKFNFYISLSLYNGISRQARKEHKTKSDLIRTIITNYLKTTDQEDQK